MTGSEDDQLERYDGLIFRVEQILSRLDALEARLTAAEALLSEPERNTAESAVLASKLPNEKDPERADPQYRGSDPDSVPEGVSVPPVFEVSSLEEALILLERRELNSGADE